MTGTPYRVCVERLERLLSPRVVSRTLQMGMQPGGLAPDTVTAAELEPILKGPVFKQLQVVMPADQARAAVAEILEAARAAERPAPAEVAGEPDVEPPASSVPSEEPGAQEAPPPTAKEPAGAEPGDRGGEAAPPDEAALARLRGLRSALRPYNLYFEWPEVRRLRAQLQRLEEELESGGDITALADEADSQLAVVASKLEDMLVLQAQDLAELEEAASEVQGLGGPKVRRLESLVKHVRDAQASRQLVDAEIERARRLARDLRKLMASSVYRDSETAPASAADLEARIEALDREGEAQDLAALARERAILLEHREDLAERVKDREQRLNAGQALGSELDSLRDELAGAEEQRRREIAAELDAAADALERLPDGISEDVVREYGVLRGVVEAGLPPLSDLVRFRDLLALTEERNERAGRDAEADAREARARLIAQGERLARARDDLLRHQDADPDPLLERMRDAVERLWRAQAEERLDPDADAELREAAAAVALGRSAGDAPDAGAREQARSLLERLEGLPSRVDPEGSAQLRRDLESWLERPPSDGELVAGAATVAAFVDRVRADARARLDSAGAEAARWGLRDVLEQVQAANERLEDDSDPELGTLERRLNEAREEMRAQQFERLHHLEREAERLGGIDGDGEARLQAALARARTQTAEGEPTQALDEAAALVGRLEATLARRIEDVMPRLDAAIAAFHRVERLNSDDVATVRRILTHLDAQRDAFSRISPGMRARLERSLQEAEDLLGSLEEEERATRAIADRLMDGSGFDDLLGLFGEEPASAPGAEGAGTDAQQPGDSAPADPADAWVEVRGRTRGVTTAALLARGRGLVTARGVPAAAEGAWAGITEQLLGTLEELGASLDLGRPTLATVERSRGALLVGAHRDTAVLMVCDEPATLGLLVRDLREDDAWRLAGEELQATADGAEDSSGAPGGENDRPRGSS